MVSPAPSASDNLQVVQLLVAVVCLLGGCHTVFGLDEVADAPPPPDAAIGVDYDGDGVFLGDVCPAIPDPEQRDEDEDGIGNACDPHPVEWDEIVVQELLDGDAPGWQVPGAWTRTPGAWTSPPPDTGGTFSWGTTRELFRPTFQIGFTIDAYTSVNNLRQLLALFDAPGSPGDCAFRYNPNNTGANSQIIIHVDGTPYSYSAADWVLGARYVGTYTRSLASVCTAAGQRNEKPDTVERFTTTPSLKIERMQVTLHHVTVYQVVP